MTASALVKLREPFSPGQIGKLPKPLKSKDEDKGKCAKGTRYSADGHYCDGWHARSIHLDYVGHAALTARFLDVDPQWSWEPVALDAKGLPAFDQFGGLWIRLTICGVTRLGYGDASGKTGGNAVKEAIGDALRNAGMRFGAALDLWHKGDLHDDTAEPEPAEPPFDSLPWEAKIAAASTKDELMVVGSELGHAHMPVAARDLLRDQYTQRMSELVGVVAA